MAQLTSPAGTFWDRSAAQSLAGGAWGGASQITLNHSLGAAPDFIIPVLTSMQALSVGAFSTTVYSPVLGALRGNASINTVQVLGPLGGAANINYSEPTISFEVYSGIVHSAVR